MRTDMIQIDSNGKGMEQALDEAEKFATYTGLQKKQALRVRLLTEEVLGMIRGIVDFFEAKFWIESEKMNYTQVCRIVVEASTRMDMEKRENLLAVSTSGKNEAAKGIMGKIREVFEIAIQGYNESVQWQMQHEPVVAEFGTLEMMARGGMSASAFTWSLSDYKDSFNGDEDQKEQFAEEWDELEKSVVANLASDVKVRIRDNKVKMTVESRYDI